jgi:Arc/MetJ-type ribon-helix-helix transcriptional regulator
MPEEAANVKKYSVSMPPAIASEVRERVGKGSFSAYVTAAVERQIERDRLAEIVDDHEQRFGPVSEDLLAAAAAESAEAERRYSAWLDEQEDERRAS